MPDEISTDTWTAPDWQQRVITEKADLDEKITKLKSFLFRPGGADVTLLTVQLDVMVAYQTILALRIKAF